MGNAADRAVELRVKNSTKPKRRSVRPKHKWNFGTKCLVCGLRRRLKKGCDHTWEFLTVEAGNDDSKPTWTTCRPKDIDCIPGL